MRPGLRLLRGAGDAPTMPCEGWLLGESPALLDTAASPLLLGIQGYATGAELPLFTGLPLRGLLGNSVAWKRAGAVRPWPS